MPESSLEKFNSIEEEPKKEEVFSPIEIPEEDFTTLKVIGKRVAGDFGIKVELGPPFLEQINPLTGKRERIPYTAFANVEDKSITFSPLYIKEKPREAKSIAAHEGAHLAISRGEHEIGLTKDQVRKLSSPEYLGFHSFRNIGLEDPRVDTYSVGRFPGLRDVFQEFYNEQLKEENAPFIVPEVLLIISKLGRYPLYAEAASELMRFWHQGRYSRELKPEIKKFLNRVQKYASQYQQNIPDVNKLHITEKEVLEKARECFTLYHDHIWPEVRKLVEMDLHIEEQRQMLQEFLQKQKELKQKMKEMEEARKRGDTQREEILQREIDALQKELDPFNGLPEDVRKELQEQIDKTIREVAEQLNKEIEEKQRQLEEIKQKIEELDREIQDLEKKVESASGEEKEKLQKEIKNKKAERLIQEMKQKQIEKELQDIQDALTDIESDREMPYPVDKLSQETKQELEKLFKKLPKSKQEELKTKARRQLEDFEDTVNEALESEFNKERPESHKERRKREERERLKKEQLREQEKLEKKLEQIRREKMTEYDKAYEKVADVIDRLYIRLKNFFLPERHPKWEKGYPSGQRLDLQKAMQAEADPRYLGGIWERKTIPHEPDYRFCLLVDTSGSMQGEKIEETFKGLVVLVEVLEKLGIQYEVIAFSDFCHIFKRWEERLNKEKRDYLSQIISFGGHGTNTTGATQEAYQELLRNLGKNNFLITLTDGQPNEPDSLKEFLKKIENERKIKLVGIGLGPNTEFVKEFYPAAIFLPKVKVSDRERLEGQKDFGETFADLLEDMIKHPEKY